VLLLAITIGALGWWFGSGRWTDVPRLAGLQRDDAVAVLQEAGLDPKPIDQQWSEDVAEGVVISADPEGGEAIRGTDVHLVVSKGQERFRVDAALVGQDAKQVVAKLQDTLPVQVTTEKRYDNELAAGRVVGFEPAAGTALKRNEPVKIIISLGHEPVVVPNVLGQSPDAAQANLEQLGFKVDRVADGRSAAVDKGEVMAVDPAPAAGPVAYGSTVKVQVSMGVPQVTVPDVTGQKTAVAKQILEKAGLKVQSTDWFGDKVVRQNPKPGTVVDLGTSVKILSTFF
jgi:serine/threonine-protein kinase